MDGRALRNELIQRTGASPLTQQAEELEVLRAEFERGKRNEDADTDVVWAGMSCTCSDTCVCLQRMTCMQPVCQV